MGTARCGAAASESALLGQATARGQDGGIRRLDCREYAATRSGKNGWGENKSGYGRRDGRMRNGGRYENRNAQAEPGAIWRLVKRTAAAVRQLVAATHEELKPVTFAALVAADVHAADIADDFEISGARLMPPRAIGVEDMPILCGYALHALYLSKDWASHQRPSNLQG